MPSKRLVASCLAHLPRVALLEAVEEVPLEVDLPPGEEEVGAVADDDVAEGADDGDDESVRHGAGAGTTRVVFAVGPEQEVVILQVGADEGAAGRVAVHRAETEGDRDAQDLGKPVRMVGDNIAPCPRTTAGGSAR